MDDEYDMKSPPELEFKRLDGSVIQFWRSKKEPYKFQAMVNGKPWDPNEIVPNKKK